MIYDLLNPYKEDYNITINDLPTSFSIKVMYGDNVIYNRGKGGLCPSKKKATMNILTAESIAKIKEHQLLILKTKQNVNM